MDDKTKSEFIQLFNQGFEDVVLPELEEIREDVKEVKNEINKLGSQMDRVEGHVDRLADKVMEYGGKIKKLESTSSVATSVS